MKLTVKDIHKETNDALSVSFANNGLFNKVKYIPGQFVTLHFNIENEIHKRAYSFSSNPFTDKDLKITVKRVEKGLVSNFIHDHLKVGDRLEIDKPNGSFYVKPEKKNHCNYVFFAGGSGITPLYSIINAVLRKEPKSNIFLVYANQHKDAIIFGKELIALQDEYKGRLHIEHLLSKAEGVLAANYHKGLITDFLVESLMEKYELAFPECTFMICGPFGFMEAVKSILYVNGVSPKKIKEELFKRPEVVKQGNDLKSKVQIQMNGSSYELEVAGNKSILQVAMANNIALPYSCRSGMCSTCKASCISGKVDMAEGHFLDEKEVDEGKILTCISYPASENLVISI